MIRISNQRLDIVEPTPEEFRSWAGQTTGKYFIDLLKNQLVDIQEDFINGDFTGNSTEETVQKNSEAIGRGQAIANILLTLEELQINDQSTEDNEE